MGDTVPEGDKQAAITTQFLEDAGYSIELADAAAAIASRLARAIASPLVVVLCEGKVVSAEGPEVRGAPIADLVKSASADPEAVVKLPRAGRCRFERFDGHESGRLDLLAVRHENREFGDHETDCMRLASVALGLIERSHGLILAERGARREAEAARESLVDRVPAVVYVSETGTAGRWRYVSSPIEDLLGYSPDEWMADPELWSASVHPADRDVAFRSEEEAVGRPGVSSRREYRLIDRHGRVRWVLDDARIELDGDGVAVWHGVIQDITERKEAETALERLADRQAGLADLSEQAVSGTDLAALMTSALNLVRGDGASHAVIWECPPRGGSLRMRVGLDRSELDSSDRLLATPDTHVGEALRLDRSVIVSDWETETRLELPAALHDCGIRSSLASVIEIGTGAFGVVDIHSERADAFDPADIHLAQSVANVLASAIQRNRADEELRHRVLHDSLTGLPNRQLFMEMLERALNRAKRNDTPIAVLFLDLDHFKVINDSLGHHVGDELLRIVAPRLVGRLRPADVVARFGGDEFGMLVEDLVDEDEAVAIAERVGQALSRPIAIEGIEHFITASIGIAVADPRAGKCDDAEDLVRDADAAMYKAKDLGRARHQLFGQEMRDNAVRRLETQHRLRHAVERDELTLEYQPIVALRGGALVGVEALVRWNHPERGLLMPHEFIPVAEESGLIGEIGGWVLESAIAQTLRWHAEHPDDRPVDIAVNISPRQVAQPGLDSFVAETVERSGIDPDRLFLEITENALVEESTTVRRTLENLSEIGVNLVLDDFGTGYSSLAYLNRFPMDVLKIDRSFVEKLGGVSEADNEGVAIVEAILAMAEALSLEVIAEGVSDCGHASHLRRMGCQYAQGFLFSHPVSTEAMTELIANPEPIRDVVKSLSARG